MEEIKRWDSRFNRPRVLIDMDDCVNNFMGYLCKVYNQRMGTNVRISNIKHWNIEEVMPGGIDIFREEGFFTKIPVKKGSINTLKELIESTRYDVYIITACGTTHELEEKIQWFKRLLPEFNQKRIISCSEKSLINGSVLIDDNLSNLDDCSPFMRCIVYDMPHNRGCKAYPRIKKLEDAVPLLEEWFYPEQKEKAEN